MAATGASPSSATAINPCSQSSCHDGNNDFHAATNPTSANGQRSLFRIHCPCIQRNGTRQTRQRTLAANAAITGSPADSGGNGISNASQRNGMHQSTEQNQRQRLRNEAAGMSNRKRYSIEPNAAPVDAAQSAIRMASALLPPDRTQETANTDKPRIIVARPDRLNQRNFRPLEAFMSTTCSLRQAGFRPGAGNQTSLTCHVAAVTKLVRLERIVRPRYGQWQT